MSGSPDIFLSYNREDAEVARRFAEGFEAQGFEVWWDQALRSGEDYDEVTENALHSAKAVVVLWSKRSVVSRWVRAEATVADRNGTLVPVAIEDCRRPVMFELKQTSDLSRWQGDANDPAWRALLADVGRMVGKDAPVATTPTPAPDPDAAALGAGVPQAGVLPFTIRGDDGELAFLAEDLTEDVTHALTENDYFKVIASGTMASLRGQAHDYKAIGQQVDARYLVEGRLQRAGDTVRLAVQLIDTETANAVWSHRFTEAEVEIASNPEVFPLIVASELAEHILQAETKRAMTKSGPYTGWEHVLRATSFPSVMQADTPQKVMREARLAVETAPDYGLAHATLAATLMAANIPRGVKLTDEMKREMRDHVARALQLDGENAAVICRLVRASMGLGDGETALRLAKRAVRLRPASPSCQNELAGAYLMFGEISEAIAAYTNQLSSRAFDSNRGYALSALGWCYLLEGNLEQADEALGQALSHNPTNRNGLALKAITEFLLGKERSAIDTVRRLREIAPDDSLDTHLALITANPRLRRMSAELIETFHRLWDETEGDG